MAIVVNVPITDLRKEPVEPSFSYEKDPLQESQLLYGERVMIKEEQGDWYFIEAIEQQKFISEKWTGYPGWMKKSHVIEFKEFNEKYPLIVHVPWGLIQVQNQQICVSMGTSLKGVEQIGENWQIVLPDGCLGLIAEGQVRKDTHTPLTTSKRQELLTLGRQLLGSPYLWGGRSAYRPDFLSSCDCSGLVGLLYRILGYPIARDAHDQFLQCKKREFSQLLPGDLIFLASEKNPQRMGHVMLYAGEDEFLDTNITDRKAVWTTGLQRFGQPFNTLAWGQTIGQYKIYFGTLNNL